MRKQYHFWPSHGGLMAWDVKRLIDLSKDLRRTRVRLSSIREMDEVYWFDDETELPTCRKVLLHMRLIYEADLSRSDHSGCGWEGDGRYAPRGEGAIAGERRDRGDAV